MIKVYIKNKEIVITGHANFALYGKDIVCASASSIVITSINAALRLCNDSVSFKEETSKLTVKILKETNEVKVIIDNMISMLEELESEYSKNIKIIKEEN